MGKRKVGRQCTVDPKNIIKGDLNNDGTVTRKEKKIVNKLAKKGIRLKNKMKSSLDKNNDGKITRSEAKGKKAKKLKKTIAKPTRRSKRIAALKK
mmetsp:Transcript_13016/g.18099  ORF Transcript_13016/g.18099 Transcript_13016/m.18099 type:complete len:95 (+) Transcript_13016:74-358(+)|eukprot:CAMPEP_0185253186 /NCGR_PEP_ID=MMETSP1359-20130426/2042_1 /TAXON_ID=552665 /ORGANISM="Bigelowiella longifila, Strain CCMP242" /LENGTH=94 /DNA_ID=CAMNT_0027835525 /DNA_START=68 /DNA_END=352 /DNA_ORIENTATION=-